MLGLMYVCVTSGVCMAEALKDVMLLCFEDGKAKISLGLGLSLERTSIR